MYSFMKFCFDLKLVLLFCKEKMNHDHNEKIEVFMKSMLPFLHHEHPICMTTDTKIGMDKSTFD